MGNTANSSGNSFGITDRRFNLDRLQDLPARLDNQKFRDWLRKGEAKMLRALEMAVRDVPLAEYAENTAPSPASRK